MDRHVCDQALLGLSEFPAPARWNEAIAMQVDSLRGHWRVARFSAPVGEQAETSKPLPAVERLYRAIDKRLFGTRAAAARDGCAARDVETAAAAADPGELTVAWGEAAAARCCAAGLCGVWVEYEGRAMHELESAVRDVLGGPGATLRAQVWTVDSSLRRKLLYQGEIALDHRSLCRSVAGCAAKLPALLRGACARRDGGVPAPAWAPSKRAAAALSAPRHLFKLCRSVVNRLFLRPQWLIEVCRSESAASGPGRTLAVLQPPADVFWADPFLLSVDGCLWLLFEELPYASQKGHISAMQIDDSGRVLGPPRVVLTEPWHLSFPFVWRADDRVFMIPDASSSRELSLYESQGGPLEWVKRRTLIEGQRLADATVVAYRGRLWMFAAQGDEGAGMYDTLHVYWAETIDGPWHPHRLNPVKIDARSSRPAGSPWVEDGVIYRVVQDCSDVYGGSIRCTRVTVLDEDDFAEELVDWGRDVSAARAHPWHTFNREGFLAVVDRLTHRRRLGAR